MKTAAKVMNVIDNNDNNDIERISEMMATRNIRVAVVGNVDSGKSTLIGTLVTNTLDDGRGSSRSAIMKHKHELGTGRTSTISHHLLGFKENGDVVIPSNKQQKKYRGISEEEIAKQASKVVTLTDLAGHEKYLKTTIKGVSSRMPDYALILVNSKQPPNHMTRHLINLVASFGIPIIVVLTKIDGCPKHVMKSTKDEVKQLLRTPEVDKKGYVIRDEHDIGTVVDKLQSIAPMISVSCVTGDGLDVLRKVLFALPKRRQHHKKLDRSFEFLVDDTFNVTGVGPVVSGFVNAGELHVGETIYVGPMTDGSYVKTTAKSFHIAQTNVNHITAGHMACIALPLNKKERKKLRTGMVILKEPTKPVRKFVAEICILKGEGTTVTSGVSQTIVHILHVKQSARIINFEMIDNGLMNSSSSLVLRSGSRARVTFEFVTRPEYLRQGMRMLFRDGKVRGIGIVKEVQS